MSDGELFYHIKNGIRHTGMPAWELPDQKIWQVSAYLRNLPKVAALSPQAASAQPAASVASAHYVGSAACKDCHTEIYDRWKKTRMATGRIRMSIRTRSFRISSNQIRCSPSPRTKSRSRTAADGNISSRWAMTISYPAQWDVMHKMWRPTL
jgi:hypothetical protein